jgi:hypothetical protein
MQDRSQTTSWHLTDCLLRRGRVFEGCANPSGGPIVLDFDAATIQAWTDRRSDLPLSRALQVLEVWLWGRWLHFTGCPALRLQIANRAAPKEKSQQEMKNLSKRYSACLIHRHTGSCEHIESTLALQLAEFVDAPAEHLALAPLACYKARHQNAPAQRERSLLRKLTQEQRRCCAAHKDICTRCWVARWARHCRSSCVPCHWHVAVPE